MKKISEFKKVADIKAVFSDLDDTMTHEMQLPMDVYQCMFKLANAGVSLIIVSGRPAGWADCLMRLWPVAAMIYENGAGVMIREGNKIKNINFVERPSGVSEFYLRDVWNKLKERFPEVKFATDQPYRVCDYTVDFNEEPPFIAESRVTEILKFIQSFPHVTAKLSSIHINFWVGNHTKLTALEKLLQLEGFKHLSLQNSIYCGDSPNDEPMFSYFPVSFGVSNVLRFKDQMRTLPSYVASREGGFGFCEIIDRVC